VAHDLESDRQVTEETAATLRRRSVPGHDGRLHNHVLGPRRPGGHYLDAKQAAASEAEQAARAGAGSLNVSQLHAGTIAVDPATAVTAAENYMTSAGQPGTAWVVGDTVYAQISYRMPTQLLGIIGVGSLALSVTESATDVSGITTGG
jgi:hypothetical protein